MGPESVFETIYLSLFFYCEIFNFSEGSNVKLNVATVLDLRSKIDLMIIFVLFSPCFLTEMVTN